MVRVTRQLALLAAASAAAGGGCAAVLGIHDPIVVGDAGGEAGARDAGSNDGDAGATDGGPDAPPSCAPGGPGLTNCGPGGSGTESCCASPSVSGGTFYRSYDNVTYTDQANPATVSPFRLDKYEVTVGRFRQFVAAVVGGWTPYGGSGKHSHLLCDGGVGLNCGTESGWSISWTSNLASTPSGWDANLMCGGDETWTSSAAANENRPIACVDWYEAYAFCIWDGGFLPSEAEWNFAAAGGSEQRAYPWSAPPTSTAIDCTFANFDPTSQCSATGPNDVGSESPKGDSLWGQADLAGNVWEWVLDWYQPYANPCSDCASLATATDRVQRGGGAYHPASALLAAGRDNVAPTYRHWSLGFRCARAP